MPRSTRRMSRLVSHAMGRVVIASMTLVLITTALQTGALPLLNLQHRVHPQRVRR